MKDFLQAMTLFLSMIMLSVVAEADELDTVLSSHFDNAKSVEYVSYERIDDLHVDEYGAYRYLVMDFDMHVSANVQQSIHAICSSVLKNIGLVTRLSEEGYDMVSVSFDRESQYDCL